MVVAKRIALTLGCAALIASLRPVYLIGVGFGLWQPLSHPSGVSRSARYVGAFKTAGWFDCSVDSAAHVDICKAWDTDGKLIAFGRYRLDGEDRAATQHELRPSMVQLYPGHPDLAWIYLFDDHRTIMGKTLIPVDEAGKPLERFSVY
jgi:hypothetical protein